MTYAKKIDINQPQIVKDLRAEGASVQILSAVGKGCPDILVGYNEVNYLMEIKYLKGTLTDDQRVWHSTWLGKVYIVRTSQEAIRLIKP
jgi:hypothetical protein